MKGTGVQTLRCAQILHANLSSVGARAKHSKIRPGLCVRQLKGTHYANLFYSVFVSSEIFIR